MENGTELVTCKNELLKDIALIIQHEIGKNVSIIPEEFQREMRKNIKTIVNDYDNELAEYRDELVALKNEMNELKKHFGVEKKAIEKLELLNDKFSEAVDANTKIQVDVLSHINKLEDGFAKAIGSVSFIEQDSKRILSDHNYALKSTVDSIIPTVQKNVRGILATEVGPTLESFKTFRYATNALIDQLKQDKLMITLVYWFVAFASVFLILPEIIFWTEKWTQIWGFLFSKSHWWRIPIIVGVFSIPPNWLIISKYLQAVFGTKK